MTEPTQTKSLIERLRHEIEHPDTSGAPYVNDPDLLAECLAAIDTLCGALNLERQRLVSWADRLNKRCKNEAADEVWERVEAIDRAMRPAHEHGANKS
jgi:hypothetical protein